MHITILVPGFGFASSVICAREVFTNAGILWHQLVGTEGADAPFEVTLASIDGEPVEFEAGITIKPHCSIEQITGTDLVFVPSIGLDLQSVFDRNQQMLAFLQHQAAKGTWIAGVCTGVAMVAEAGLLDGRPATTHWALADEYARRYPAVAWQPALFVIESGNLSCGGGVYGALDLCLHLVEKFAGYEVAKQCGRALLIDSPRTWQSSFAVPLINQQHHDEQIQRAQDYMHEFFNAQFTIDELATRVGMSTRNFARRFKLATNETPLAYLHQLRINCAKQLLESDYKSIAEICYEVGYEDVPFFRSVFKRSTGLAPREYRERFGRRIRVRGN